MKKLLTVCLLFGVLSLILAFSESKQDTKVFVSNDAKVIETIIEQWGKYGYKVDKIISQSISTSINSRTYVGEAPYLPSYRDVKGDIILIMIK